MSKRIGLLLLAFLLLGTGCTGIPFDRQNNPLPSEENQKPPHHQNPLDTQPNDSQPSATPKTPEVAWPGSTEIRGDGGPFINVQEPTVWAKVKSPIQVKGKARVWEANLLVHLKDEQGKIISKKIVTASQGAPGIGDYSTELTYGPEYAGKTGFVEVLTHSAKDGSIDQMVSIAVELQ